MFRLLDEHQVKYLVIGGLAVNLHGYDRVTGDLDIIVSFEKENLEALVAAIKSLGWRSRLPVPLEAFADSDKRKSWIEEKGMRVFTVYNPRNEAEHLDIMTENYLDFKKAYRGKKVVSAGGVPIPLVSIPDLIRLKKIAGRGRDKIDIGALEKIQEFNRGEKKK